MNVRETGLPGLLLIEPKVFRDDRGYFLETWTEERYRASGISATWVQENLSCSHRGVLRGMHYQEPNPQAKLVSVPQGEVFDAVIDIRVGSPTFGRWEGHILSAENARQLYIPEGFAHGFVVLSESARFAYKCSAYYHPGAEGAVLWNDPDIGIDWPVPHPRLSAKDRAALRLREIPEDRLPAL